MSEFAVNVMSQEPNQFNRVAVLPARPLMLTGKI